MSGLDHAWKRLLLIQFHDGLPGSSIGMVYDEAAKDYEAIGKTASGITEKALEVISGKAPKSDVLVFNTLSWPRSDVAEAWIPKTGKAVEVVDNEGRAAAAQVVGSDKKGSRIVFAAQEVPAMGYATFAVREATGKAETSLSVSKGKMENRYFAMELDGNGEIKRLYDKRQGREVVPKGTTGNQLQFSRMGRNSRPRGTFMRRSRSGAMSAMGSRRSR